MPENSPAEQELAMGRPLSPGELVEVGQRMKNGLLVTPEERQQVEAVDAKIAGVVAGFEERYGDALAECRRALSQLPDMLQQFRQWMGAIAQQVAPVVEAIAIGVRDLPPNLQSALLTLGENGWYLDGEWGLSELWPLERALLEGRVEEVDALLVERYEQRLDDIETGLIAALPKREKILRAAFGAHRRQEYELSVPVLLAQADGACLDLTGFALFLRADGKPQVARYVANVAQNVVSTALLSPLADILPINAGPKERQRLLAKQGIGAWRELNRHQVLHGESCDYGTQVNSLKAISLINYLVGFLADRSQETA